jgi:putative molybdopterin biosynthesis protein
LYEFAPFYNDPASFPPGTNLGVTESVSRQTQFLNVVDREEAHRRFNSVLNIAPLGVEEVAIDAALGRVLSQDMISKTNVPSFDRSNFDGFAVQAGETVGADENHPVHLKLRPEKIAAGDYPEFEIFRGEAVSIATGGMVPRGANAICLIENTEAQSGSDLLANRSVFPGSGITFAGTDISIGETVLRAGQKLSSRETGVLAALGETQVSVFRQPKVAVISTGNEIIPPGGSIQPGQVYDSNARMIADAVKESGGEPWELGIAIDDMDQLTAIIDQALASADVVLLSGGTSKGEGDLSYQVVSRFTDPGIVVHGVALKPGKPICLGVTCQKPIVILPGFPTSAVFTFHEFVAPLIRGLAGVPSKSYSTVGATLASKVQSAVGRTEYLLVGLTQKLESNDTIGLRDQHAGTGCQSTRERASLRAFPMGKGSGSVTTFSQAEGFITIDRQTEFLDANTEVAVQLISPKINPPDLVFAGSHCIGVDHILGELQKMGFLSKYLAIGSTGGLRAVESGDCDLAGLHLLDPVTGEYNIPFVSGDLGFQKGYFRRQGIVFRQDDARFQSRDSEQLIQSAVQLPNCLMINRNQGSGTRMLIDQLLERNCQGGQRPAGYEIHANNHHAVCSAIQQSRADWGIAIESVVDQTKLKFIPIADESYDFVIAPGHQGRPAVQAFFKVLGDPAIREILQNRKLLF